MYVRPLRELTARDLAIAGGKGANLGELVSAGFPVPPGFVITTEAFALATAGMDLADATAARERVRTQAVPTVVADAVLAAYRALGGRVAVRSSATAEDLPDASFAGQQDTLLGVVGEEALLEAIRRCWASLWNERAVAYRATHAVGTTGLGLAVVVQRMVDAQSAGVLFTADPITGRRGLAVIDAVHGLGEQLVSGAVNPDHLVVDPSNGSVLERHGDAVTDARLRELASLGARIEAHFGRPQDIEWAIDTERVWIVQSRDITTLYPLPPDLPDPATDLRVLFSANVAQGVFQPFTTMGLQTFRLMSSGFAILLGAPPRDLDAGSDRKVVRESGMRLWIDVTEALRDRGTRELPLRALSVMEARSEGVVSRLLDDPRLAPHAGSALRTRLRVLRAVVRTGAPPLVLGSFLRPAHMRERLMAEFDALVNANVGPTTTATERIRAFERLLTEVPPRLFPRLVSLAAAGFLAYNAAGRVLGRAVQRDELRSVLRGLPYNPTTEMDLALWDIAHTTRAGEEEDRALKLFLERYGHRAVAEIDIGLPRWSEDPSHLRAAIASYRRITDAAASPDVQFARGAREAEDTIAALLARVHGPKRAIAGALLRRVRELSGLREMPKFQIIRLFARGRAMLAPIGDELAAAGRVERADDLWFLTLPEVRRAIAGEDLHEVVAARRAEYAREFRRRRVPRILLSDGTDAEAAFATASGEGIRGVSASAGVARGPARVLRSPDGATLEPGEVLVAPATDPGWTPLFLTASALVMEMGGMMSHGAVVAREYGIPAVVGVPNATERIATGQRLRVDGSAGTVEIEP